MLTAPETACGAERETSVRHLLPFYQRPAREFFLLVYPDAIPLVTGLRGSRSGALFFSDRPARDARRTAVLKFRATRVPSLKGDYDMQWTTPQFTDLRFGFEITMYIANR